ncbi:hypothetical protein EVA_15846 [gut metagenome]|uniref:Uncharacterized protein n=1 Tax=gut metagenome TaxID=749906 RepID=J9G2N8_9ZZZZ
MHDRQQKIEVAFYEYEKTLPRKERIVLHGFVYTLTYRSNHLFVFGCIEYFFYHLSNFNH